MKQIRFRAGLLLFGTVMVIGGCGDDTPAPPKGAMRPPEQHAPVNQGKTTWTLEEKIAAIEKSSLSPDQKKSAIDKVKAGG